MRLVGELFSDGPHLVNSFSGVRPVDDVLGIFIRGELFNLSVEDDAARWREKLGIEPNREIFLSQKCGIWTDVTHLSRAAASISGSAGANS